MAGDDEDREKITDELYFLRDWVDFLEHVKASRKPDGDRLLEEKITELKGSIRSLEEDLDGPESQSDDGDDGES